MTINGPDTGDRGSETEGLTGPTLLERFATEGVMGLLDGLADEVTADDDVEDPEALRLAEEAVARDEPLPDSGQPPIDEDWAVVARQTGQLVVGLDEVARMLEAAGLAIGWDPFDPRESVAFTPPGLGGSVRTYAVFVPASQIGRAREVLGGIAPEGVSLEWAAGPGDQQAAGVSDAGVPTAVTSYGRPTSDNALLERLASGGPSIGTIALVTGAVLLVVLMIFIALKGLPL